MSRGFLILAENTKKVDYIKCAEALAISIHRCMPRASVTLLTAKPMLNSNFDMICSLPYGDLDPDSEWKLLNDWQVYKSSPYNETIKLEADMFIPRSIEHWWDVLKQQDVVVSSSIRDFRGNLSSCRVYRRLIDDNDLPDVYNAITYFKKSPLAEKFFAVVRDVFENWSAYKAILKCNEREEVTTDWAYALACHIIGREQTMIPGFTEMSMAHMKQYVNSTIGENWMDSLVYERLPHMLRINGFPQEYPMHYHIKSFADVLMEYQNEN